MNSIAKRRGIIPESHLPVEVDVPEAAAVLSLHTDFISINPAGNSSDALRPRS